MRALGEEPTLVTLLVGANDMLRRTTRHSLSDNFQAVLSQLPAQTVVAYLPQPVALARQVNRLIDERAASTGLHPVSVRPAARHFRGRAADLFHPNDRGYQRLADIVVRPSSRSRIQRRLRRADLDDASGSRERVRSQS
jgi:lysophospholipase L1-like esterase